MKTEHLELVAQAPGHLLALIKGTENFERSSGLRVATGLRELLVSDGVSPEFLEQLRAGSAPDPWTFGFMVTLREQPLVIGMVGYKGPPDENGVVEIAYGIAPDYRGLGYATEAAQSLVAYAFATGNVRLVRAHTLPKPNASTRVLTKCGFQKVSEVIDPDDGLVWRWERLPISGETAHKVLARP